MTAGSPPDKSDSGTGPWPVEAPALGGQSDGSATLKAPPAAVPCVLVEDSLPTPPASLRGPTLGSHGEPLAPGGGRVERLEEAAPRGASAPSRERRGARGATGSPRGLGPCHRVPPRRARTAPGARRLGGPAGQPRVDGSPVRGTPASLSPTTPMARSSPKRLWSWRVPCTVPLGKISRWKPVRQ